MKLHIGPRAPNPRRVLMFIDIIDQAGVFADNSASISCAQGMAADVPERVTQIAPAAQPR